MAVVHAPDNGNPMGSLPTTLASLLLKTGCGWVLAKVLSLLNDDVAKCIRGAKRDMAALCELEHVPAEAARISARLLPIVVRCCSCSHDDFARVGFSVVAAAKQCEERTSQLLHGLDEATRQTLRRGLESYFSYLRLSSGTQHGLQTAGIGEMLRRLDKFSAVQDAERFRQGGAEHVFTEVHRAADQDASTLLKRLVSEIESLSIVDALRTGQELRDFIAQRGSYLTPAATLEIVVELAHLELVKSRPADDLTSFKHLLVGADTQAPIGEESRMKLNALKWFSRYLDSGITGSDMNLGNDADPWKVYFVLMALTREKKTRAAAALVDGLRVSEVWSRLAVSIYVDTRQKDKALEILKWAAHARSPNTYTVCAVTYCYAMLFSLASIPHVHVTPLNEDQRNLFSEIAPVLDSLFERAMKKRRLDSEAERQAADLCAIAYHALGDQRRSADALQLLSDCYPIPVRVGEAVCQGIFPASEGIVERFRQEHPHSFRARRIACTIESACLSKHSEALKAAAQLCSLVSTDGEKRELQGLLVEIASQLGDKGLSELRPLLPSILGDGSYLDQLLDADICLRSGRTEEAIRLLEAHSHDQDPYWLQLYGNALLTMGRRDDALKYLGRACDITMHPALIEQCAQLAIEKEDYPAAMCHLCKLVHHASYEQRAREWLAIVYLKTHDYSKCLDQYSHLHRKHPERRDYIVNMARLQAKVFHDKEEAIRLYDEVLWSAGPIMGVVVEKALLLRAMERPGEAFALMKEHYEKVSKSPEYLVLYMDLAYASGNDAQGVSALAELRSMMATCRVNPKLAREVTQEELVEQIESGRQRVNQSSRMIVDGMLPWTLADTAGYGRPIYLGWAFRTQSVEWLNEDVLTRGQYTLYSTHGVRITKTTKGEKAFCDISCPQMGTEVVADISALITIHKLGLLSVASTYFSKVLIPVEYMVQALDDQSQMIPHQLSIRVGLTVLNRALADGSIGIAGDVADMAALDEYGTRPEQSGRRVSIRDVLTFLYNAGHIEQKVYSGLPSAYKAVGGAQRETTKLTAGERVLCEVSSLMTLHHVGCLGEAMSCLRILVSQEAKDEIVNGSNAFSFVDGVRTDHESLWREVRNLGNILRTAEPSRTKAHEHNRIGLRAFELAVDRKMSLIADDRALQEAFSNETAGVFQCASGSDALIRALRDNNLITTDSASDHLLQLMKWRYRFIVLEATELKGICDRYALHPPGNELRFVARYVQDCMRDVGLLPAFRDTDPPRTYANHTFGQWIASALGFVMLVWADTANYDDTKAAEVTRWAITELLPAIPVVLPMRAQGVAAYTYRRLVLSQSVVFSMGITAADRACSCLRLIAELLAIGDADYETIVTQV